MDLPDEHLRALLVLLQRQHHAGAHASAADIRVRTLAALARRSHWRAARAARAIRAPAHCESIGLFSPDSSDAYH